MVHVDELCTSTVNRTPIINPTMGLDSSPLEKTDPEKCNDVDEMMSMHMPLMVTSYLHVYRQ